MIFWDTSAIVPLIVDEPTTPSMLGILEEDPYQIVWWGTPIECLSALARRQREGTLTMEGYDKAHALLEQLRESWSEILPVDIVRAHAGRLLLRHPLRAADALQLGAALAWTEGAPAGHRFLTLDERLAGAGRGEGFLQIGWTRQTPPE